MPCLDRKATGSLKKLVVRKQHDQLCALDAQKSMATGQERKEESLKGH